MLHVYAEIPPWVEYQFDQLGRPCAPARSRSDLHLTRNPLRDGAAGLAAVLSPLPLETSEGLIVNS